MVWGTNYFLTRVATPTKTFVVALDIYILSLSSHGLRPMAYYSGHEGASCCLTTIDVHDHQHHHRSMCCEPSIQRLLILMWRQWTSDCIRTLLIIPR